VQQQASVKKKIKCTQETVRDQWSILLLWNQPSKLTKYIHTP